MKFIPKASAICATVVTALAASAATAQAIEPAYFYNSDNSMQVSYGEGGGAIFATITDLRNPPGAIEVCIHKFFHAKSTSELIP